MNPATKHQQEDRISIAASGRTDGAEDGSIVYDNQHDTEPFRAFPPENESIVDAVVPDTILTIGEMEQLMSKAKMTLSFQERTRAMEEMHGIAPDAPVSTENPFNHNPQVEFVQYRQRLLESAARIVGTPTQSSHGIAEPDLMWAFLQSCSQHSSIRAAALLENDGNTIQNIATKAAAKYTEYQRIRENLFSASTSATPQQLKLADLNGLSREILNSGCFQILPHTDSLGRRIIVIFPQQIPPETHNADETSMLQAAFYLFSKLQFSSNDNRDCVMIYYDPHHSTEDYKMTMGRVVLQSVLDICCRCMPIRLVAIHICVANSSTTMKSDGYLPPFWKTLDPALQARSAFHFVDFYRDFQNELRRFGMHFSVPGSPSMTAVHNAIAFPMEADGKTISAESHLDWMQSLQAQEDSGILGDDFPTMSTMAEDSSGLHLVAMDSFPTATMSSSSNPADSTVEGATNATPKDADVLFGRGMAIQRHYGNIAFRNRLLKNVDSYYAADNIEKVVLVDFLYHKFLGDGVRFLRHELPEGASQMASLAHAGSTPSLDSSSSSGRSSSQSNGNASSTSPIPLTTTTTTMQQDLIYHGRWVEETDKKAIHSKFCQTFRSIRAAQRRAEKKNEPEKG